MEKFLNKKYEIQRKDDNYDAYLEAIGLSEANRKLAKTITSLQQLVKLSSNEYSFNTIFGSTTIETKFVPGQETERTTPDGRKVKTTFTIEGNKLIEREIGSNREVTSIKTFSDNELFVENIVGDITARAWFKFVE